MSPRFINLNCPQLIVKFISRSPLGGVQGTYKTAMLFVPYRSLFLDYPSLRSMVPTALSRPQRESLLAIGEVVSATRYADRAKQRAFLDEKTVALVGFQGPPILCAAFSFVVFRILLPSLLL